jgi:hypothetical protein
MAACGAKQTLGRARGDDRFGPKADGVDGSCSRHQSAKVVEAIKQPRAKGAIRNGDYYNRP